MDQPVHTLVIFIPLIVILLQVSRSMGDARSQTIKMYCDEGENNQTEVVQNFVSVMVRLGKEMQTSHNATASVGISPNDCYGLSQCYGDLSLQDCQLCSGQIRIALPACYPKTGSQLYSDGCFMRLQNYSFYEEYTGPDDTIVCGNITRKSTFFQESTSRAVNNAVTGALRNPDYFAREEVITPGSNDSV